MKNVILNFLKTTLEKATMLISKLREQAGWLIPLLLLIIVGAAIWMYSSYVDQKLTSAAVAKKTKDETDRPNALIPNQRLVAFCVRNHAVPDWQRDLSGDLYTIDLQDALMRADHRPILITNGRIYDVRRTDSVYLVSVKEEFSHSTLYFQLSADGEIINTIRKNKHNLDYDMIVHIAAVRRTAFQVIGDVVKDEKDQPSAEISIDNGDDFIITGQCLGIETSDPGKS